MKESIVVAGSANVDMIIKSERFPESGETLLGGDFHMLPGGKGANQAVAAARLGGNVNFICRVGDDEFGKRSIEGYKKEGIATDYIIIDSERPTGVAQISVNEAGENKIVVAPGANSGFTREEIEAAYPLFLQADIIVLQLEIPLEAVSQILHFAKKNQIKVIFNPAPAQKLPEWFYENLYLISPNETEAEQLTGIKIEEEAAALKSAERFQAMGVKNVVITMGNEGAFMAAKEFTGLIPAPEINVEDTTAAGDVFNGAMAVALTQNHSWKAAVQFACNAAALSVSKIGAQNSAPSREELQQFKAKNSTKKASYPN
jgi:ribokinase